MQRRMRRKVRGKTSDSGVEKQHEWSGSGKRKFARGVLLLLDMVRVIYRYSADAPAEQKQLTILDSPGSAHDYGRTSKRRSAAVKSQKSPIPIFHSVKGGGMIE